MDKKSFPTSIKRGYLEEDFKFFHLKDKKIWNLNFIIMTLIR